MPGGLLNGQQQKDPKHKVKADEHRQNVVILIKPSGTPQSIEQDVTPKGIKQAHQDQDNLQHALTLHTALLFVGVILLCRGRVTPGSEVRVIQITVASGWPTNR